MSTSLSPDDSRQRGTPNKKRVNANTKERGRRRY